MLFQMIGLYQYTLKTEVSTCFCILSTVIEIERSVRIKPSLLRHLFIDFDGWLLFLHGVREFWDNKFIILLQSNH